MNGEGRLHDSFLDRRVDDHNQVFAALATVFGGFIFSSVLAGVRGMLRAAADELRANSKLTPGQYRDPKLGLVFLGLR